MPDPAFLLLMQHLQAARPAITRSAPVELGGPSTAAYSDYVSRKEREFDDWKTIGRDMRTTLWRQLGEGTLDLTVGMLDDMIDLHHRQAVEEAKTIRRLEKSSRRDETNMKGMQKSEIVTTHRRLIDVALRYYDEGRDFAMLLHALRYELGPKTSGPSFSKADELRTFLMT